MTTNSKNNGLLICGACAISADPKSSDPSSVERLGKAARKIFARKQPSQNAGSSFASPLPKVS